MKWILYVLAGWSTLVTGLFLASLSSDHLIQGLVMSGLVIPIILYLYQHVYRMTGVKPKTPVYSWKRLHHFISGVILAISLATFGFFISDFLGWIDFEKWQHPSEQWFIALTMNILFAFFYEALPEEFGLRGMLYDVLRYRFTAWLSVLLQTLLFVAFTIAVAQIQALVGLAPGVSINLFYIILIFFFGICLQLLRLWTGSLWTSIGFHLAYLEILRFAVSPHLKGLPPIITYHESAPGITHVISICMMIIGGIIVSLVILGAKRFIRKST
ncbi:CPBP family intramembrane metalloprotease [Lysinibacillus xylanilyticus]|uniref:CPBP family intramembrane glutamic endopeptidase n=1 Tax=Lysinibacillus xylanilyticus TaxID=582475 RepID=UPI002B2503F2|nr:CPBP family intramembrane glutamic endopeptidase [Lysinibacillus xylanilyticus]MEB2298403.1 CPBP family intramembrane metalloprotease [Lysinibacillus xylanilyticus]